MAESVTITDNRTGESIEIPIVNGGVDAGSWKKLLGNIWFAGLALVLGVGAGWVLRGKYGSKI